MAYTSNQLTTIATSARTSKGNNTIDSVTFDRTRLKSGATSLSVNVTGGDNSVFSMRVTRSSDGFFYNFFTKTFLVGTTTSQSRLANQSPGSFGLVIPAASNGDVYTVIIMAEPHFGTKLSIGSDEVRYARNITQLGDAVLQIAVGEYAAIKGQVVANPSGSIINKSDVTATINEVQLTMTVTSADHGFFITTPNSSSDINNGSWSDDVLSFTTTQANAGGTSASSDQVVVTDLSELVVGMELTYVTGTTAPGAATTITAIDVNTKTLTLSRNQEIADQSSSGTMTFRAYGSRLIQKSTGIDLSLKNGTIRVGPSTTTSRTAITSDVAAGSAFDVNGTKGIGVGSTIRMRGLQKNVSSSVCAVSAVSGSTGGGTITLANGTIGASSARPLRAGTTIYIDNGSSDIFISGSITISRFPASTKNIFIDASRILTARTAS